jgi:8-oxo-dGTP diphosphatase
MNPSNLFNILVGVIPVRHNQVLLLQRSDNEEFLPGRWGLPSGKIHFGETPEEAVRRELKEEAGLSGRIRALAGYSMFISHRGRRRLHNLQLNYLVDVEDGNVAIDPSSQQNHAWVSFELLDDDRIDEFTLEAIKQARQCQQSLDPPS